VKIKRSKVFLAEDTICIIHATDGKESKILTGEMKIISAVVSDTSPGENIDIN